MEIKLHEITVRELFDGYENNDEDGVVAECHRLSNDLSDFRVIENFGIL